MSVDFVSSLPRWRTKKQVTFCLWYYFSVLAAFLIFFPELKAGKKKNSELKIVAGEKGDKFKTRNISAVSASGKSDEPNQGENKLLLAVVLSLTLQMT